VELFHFSLQMMFWAINATTPKTKKKMKKKEKEARVKIKQNIPQN